MGVETVVLGLWLGGCAILAGWITWLGMTGQWSDDSWPAFLPVALFWPLLLVLGPTFFVSDMVHAWWHGDDFDWREWR